MSPLSKRRLKLWIRMLGVTRTTEARLRDYLRREHNTTLPRFDVLAALWRNRDGLTMGELSRMLLVSNGNATAVVNRLETDGWAAREVAAADRRQVVVRLTPEGAAAFEGMANGHEAEVDDIFANLDDSELDTLHDLLRKTGRRR